MGRRQDLADHSRRVERNARLLGPRIAGWLRKRAKAELVNALDALKRGKPKLKKSEESELDQELVDLLTKFGIRQMKDAVNHFGGEWVVRPSLIDEVINTKKIKVKRLSRNIRDRVLEKIRAIIRQANSEDPRPSIGEVSRRLRETFSPDARNGIWALSTGRAALIARTECKQNESTGIFHGMEAVEVEVKEWLASGNPNHGDRRHDLMDGQQRLLHEPFKNPTTGNELMHPGDPNADIKETAQCGCSFRSLRLKDAKRLPKD